MKKIKVIIDGKEVITREGKTILEVAKEANIYIPTLCYHPFVPPFGGCRLCIVEVEGMKGYPTSCTTPIQEGMKIKTNTPEIQDIRRQILELILTEHPNSCLVCQHKENCDEYKSTIRKVDQITGCEFCPNNNQCELQEVVKYLGIEKINLSSIYRDLPIERDDPFFERDYNLCILCGRCVRVCQEIRGAGTLTFVYRGPKTVIGTAFNRSHIDAGCQFCGACVDVCPTGALSEKGRRWEGTPDRVITSICPYCGMGCQLNIEIKKERVIGASPDPKGNANEGQACVRGKFTLRNVVYSSNRILNPLIRKNGKLEEVSWEEALNYVTDKLKNYKGEEIALITSSRLTNEDYYLAQKLARNVLKTNNIDALSRLTQIFHPDILNNSSYTYSFQEIKHAKCILIMGSDPGYAHPVINVKLKKAGDMGAMLFVVGPRKICLGTIPFEWIPISPGSEFYFLLGLIKYILESKEKSNFKNLNKFQKILNKIDYKEIEKFTGISYQKIAEISNLINDLNPSILIYGSEILQNGNGLNVIKILNNLSLISGVKLIHLWAESNARGAFTMGISPDLLPGHKKIDDEQARENFEKKWQFSLPDNSGQSLFEIINNLTIKALYLIGDIPDFKNLNLDLLIVQNSFLTNICEKADIILPACTFAETEGTFINSEGRIQFLNKAIEPLGNSKPDWWILSKIGEKLGASDFKYKSIKEIMEEIKKLIPEFHKISYSKLKRGESLFINSFNGKDKFFEINNISFEKSKNKKFPFLLIFRNDLDNYRGLSLAEEDKGINKIRGEEYIEVNPNDVSSLKLSPGDKVKVVSNYGEIEAKVKFNEDLHPKTLYLRSSRLIFSFFKSSNLPINPDTKLPELQLIPVNILRGKND